jgi:hypothetical protein
MERECRKTIGNSARPQRTGRSGGGKGRERIKTKGARWILKKERVD